MFANTLNSRLEARGAIKKAKTRKVKATKKQELHELPIQFGTKSEPGKIEIMLPLRTLSPNQCEPWRKRHAREKIQKRAVMFAMIPIKEKLLPLLQGKEITLKFTRYAPKFLDAHDNLPMSVKKICDQTCAEIINDFVPGRADSYSCFKFEYDQVKSKEYAVKIEILF